MCLRVVIVTSDCIAERGSKTEDQGQSVSCLLPSLASFSLLIEIILLGGFAPRIALLLSPKGDICRAAKLAKKELQVVKKIDKVS